jgi:hypothetical protein
MCIDLATAVDDVKTFCRDLELAVRHQSPATEVARQTSAAVFVERFLESLHETVDTHVLAFVYKRMASAMR